MGAVDGALTGAVIQPSSARPWKPIALAAAVLVALVAGGLALRPKESPTQLEVVPPPPPPVALLDEVTLKITTQPEGARVTRGDTGEVLGVTPLDFKSARRTMPTPLRVELNGFEPLERAVVLDSNQRLEFTLKAIPAAVKPKPRRVVTDGVLDPY